MTAIGKMSSPFSGSITVDQNRTKSNPMGSVCSAVSFALLSPAAQSPPFSIMLTSLSRG